MELAGNVAIVTGGASGLGEATWRSLHAKGSQVVVFDRDKGRADALAAELGGPAVAVAGDVLSEDDTAAAIAAAEEMGPLRIVVACSGGARGGGRTVDRSGKPHDLSLFADTVSLNLVGTFNTVRLCAAAMATHDPPADDDERGVVITTASIAGYEGQIGQIAYGSAKAGIIGMTIIAARDLAAIGVRVNSIAPGTMLTRAWDKASAQLRASLESKVPFARRVGYPEEFESLCEHQIMIRYFNGQVIRAHGEIRFDP